MHITMQKTNSKTKYRTYFSKRSFFNPCWFSLISQSALKQAISNRKTMKNNIAQTTSEDVFSSFVVYQDDILKFLSCSTLVFKKGDNFIARVQTQEISTHFKASPV